MEQELQEYTQAQRDYCLVEIRGAEYRVNVFWRGRLLDTARSYADADDIVQAHIAQRRADEYAMQDEARRNGEMWRPA